MSFTLIRHKNGKPTPIKLSIWDAFKGAPPPKPRLHECPQCGKFHHPNTKHESQPSVQVPAGKAKAGMKDGKPTEQGKPESAPNEHNFTAEEDAKILEMKAENATWAEIAESLGNERTKGMVQHRYKQIKPAETKSEEKASGKSTKADKREEKTEEKPFEQMSKAEKKVFKAKQAREEGLKKKEEVKAKEEKDKAATTAVDEKASSTTSATTSEPAPATETTTSQFAMEDKQKWIAAASKHFDKIGQRITPEQARKMAEGAS